MCDVQLPPMKNAIGGTVNVCPSGVVIVIFRMCSPGKKRFLSMMKFGPPVKKEDHKIILYKYKEQLEGIVESKSTQTRVVRIRCIPTSYFQPIGFL